MQDALIAIVDALSTYQQFGGMAEDVTEPDTENNVFYFALKGTYPQFGGLEVGDYEIGIFISYEDPEELDEEGNPVIKWKDVGIPVPPGPKGDPGRGVPDGGTIGQVLAKQSDEDGDTEWVEPGNITVDPYPIEDSTNPVQSGGVYDALGNLYQALSVAENCLFGGVVTSNESPSQGDDHRYYYITQQVGYFQHFDVTVANNEPTAVMIYWSDVVSKWVTLGLWPKLTYVDAKADKVDGATQGDLAGIDSEGNLTDSGIAASDVATTSDLAGKQDTISDLATIRSGAAAGATAVQPSDLATVATSGSYNDLLNKPTIPAAQVNSDWNADSGVAQILNKPTIPDVSGKADKVSGATNGDFAGLDANGNLTDSGKKASDFATPIPVVDASTNPTSMDADKVYQYGTLSGDTTFPALNTPSDLTVAHVYCWTFTTPATAPTITWPSAITDWAGGSAPTINASKSYEVSVMDGFATIIEN